MGKFFFKEELGERRRAGQRNNKVGLIVMKGIKVNKSVQDGQLRQEAKADHECCECRILKMTGGAGMRGMQPFFGVQEIEGEGCGRKYEKQKEDDEFLSFCTH